jgi:hypothetical protein
MAAPPGGGANSIAPSAACATFTVCAAIGNAMTDEEFAQRKRTLDLQLEAGIA